MALDEWYEERDLFHIIGFVLHQTEDGLATITELLEHGRKSGKQAFAKSLRSRVCQMVCRQDLETIEPEELAEEITALCQTIGYGNRAKVRSLLLLFNLASLLQDPDSNIRFQFDSFKRQSWDIEHIRSVNDTRPSRHTEQNEWLEQCLKFLRTIHGVKEKILADQIETYLDPKY